MQVLTHVASPHDGSATFYGRARGGALVTCVVPNFRAVWVRNAWLAAPPNAERRFVHGRGLLAADPTAHFHEYWIRGRTPRKDFDEQGWYNRRLGKVEAFYAREGIPPGTWFTSTRFMRDDQMARAADRDDACWAPFRLLVFDMECLPKLDGGFPEASADAIIQISVVMDYDMLQGREGICHLWTWRPTVLVQIDEFDPSGCTLHVSESEREMLHDFVRFIRDEDPDVISGWNVQGFDLPYLLARCDVLGVHCSLARGRHATRLLPRGGVSIPGRVVADMLPMWRAQHRERSYKLGDVAAAHLDATKAPVHYSDMRRLWDGDRGPLATYCLKDSWLVWRLGATRNVWMNAFQMAKVTFVPLDRIVNGGQQIRVFTLLTHHAHQAGVYIPDAVPVCDAGYEGAVVLPPLPGLYRDCVVTLDFASLYPSIMMAFNMCYTTLRTEVTAFELARSLKIPASAARCILAFVPVPTAAIPADARAYHRCGAAAFRREPRGILPGILDALLQRRKAAKREMAQADGGLPRAIADGKQLALKLVANSLYGFTGAAKLGMLPQPQIAAAVTYMGRQLTLGTKSLCEKEDGVVCVYGDSVTADTALVIRVAGSIQTCRIDALAQCWQPYGDKEQQLLGDVEVWSDRGWTNVRRVIRHRTNKPIVRVLTHTGVVDATEDHSLLNLDGTEVSPCHLQVGNQLLHAPLPGLCVETGGVDVKEAWLMGMFMGDGSCGAYYYDKSSWKYSWAINNADLDRLRCAATCMQGIGLVPRIYDTMASSGVYKLNVMGDHKALVLRYRKLFYNAAAEKIVPHEMLSAPHDVVVAFVAGYYEADGDKTSGAVRCDLKGKEGACGMHYLLSARLGMNVSINTRHDKPNIFRLNASYGTMRRCTAAIKKMHPVSATDGYVYDLETCNHHFHVGPGTMIVHNTDSVFLRLEGVTDVAQASARATELAAMVDALIPAPNRLEFEKVYLPLLLKGKKRYCGRKFDEGEGDGELDVKGLEMVRRDNFPLLPAVQRAAMEQLVLHDSPEGADRVVREALVRMARAVHADLAEFTIAKELTKPPADYAAKPPHVRVALQMPTAPSVRDRIPYVVTRGRGGVGDRAVHPEAFDPAVHELDTDWYAQQLSRAMRRLLELSSPDVEAVFAPVQGAVTATGGSGIMRALGAPAGLVWRKSAPAAQRPRKRARQMDMRQFF